MCCVYDAYNKTINFNSTILLPLTRLFNSVRNVSMIVSNS